MRFVSLLILSFAVGCSDDQKAGGGNPVPPPPGENPGGTTKSEPTPELKLEELQQGAENIALVPSPAEMQRALDKAGIAKGLSAMVADRTLKMDVENKDVVAVRTGVALADALLTVKDAPKEKLVARLDVVKAGMTSLGGGADIGATIDDLKARISNDSISRDDLVKELDEMHGAMIPEIKYEAGAQVVPLIQAGSWLEGSNLVSQAIVEANKGEAGTQLLRQPQVVEYFQKYVQVEGAGKAPNEVVTQLDTTLKKLKEIAAKPTLTLDDCKEVKSQTDAVLALL